jgi:type II secretory ATPase GspE/PulE/Tfp pilus assembly ATPase PilB-like protein
MHQLRHHARRAGMRTLVEDGLDKAAAGITSLAELLRVVPQRLIAAERVP